MFVNTASFMRHILFRSLHQAHGSLRIIDNQHTNNNPADVRQMINWGVVCMGKERRHCSIIKGTEISKKEECLDNIMVKNCCAYRTGENNSVRSNTEVGPRGNIGIKIFGIVLSALVVFFNYSPRMRAVRALPKAVFINSVCLDYLKSTLSIFESESTAHGQEGALNVTESGDETLGAKRISVRLFNLFELANVPIYNQERAMLYPGGRAVGISINLRGLLIVGSGSFRNRDGRECCPAKRAGFRAGDVILSINGTAVSTSEEMQLALNANPDSAQIVFERNNRRQTLTVKPEMGTDGKAKIGAWVRDSTVGIGTLSFVTEKEKASAALGHAVLDADTGSLLNVRIGEMVEADVLGVTKGSSGFPGELRGAFGAKSLRIGSIDVNTELGIFGIADSADYTCEAGETLPIAFPNEVHNGEAYIITQIDGEKPQPYSCKIIKNAAQSVPSQKGLVIEITDDRLLNKTGGIVQGMSGSPIVQDGRIAAVVTHVFVNEPNRGYGVYAFWMYSVACGEN